MGFNVKKRFRSSLKRGICWLICFTMVAAVAFLSSVFSFSAFAAGGKTVEICLGNDFKKMKENFNKSLSDAYLKDADIIKKKKKKDIEIKLDSDFSKTSGMGNGYLFNFSSNKFKNKTINIKSKGNNVFKIKNKNENVGFLKAKGCIVNLERVEVFGGAIYKEYKIPCTKAKFGDGCVCVNRNFVDLSNNCVLSLNNKASINDVFIGDAEYHAIKLNESQINMNGGGVSRCRTESEDGCSAGGAVYADNQSSVILNSSGYITKCSVYQSGLAKGGAVCLDNGSMLEIKDGGLIDSCFAAGDYAVGGAVSAEHKSTVIMSTGGQIKNCCSLGNNSCGGAMFVDVESCLDLKGGEILDCKAGKYGDAIYFAGGGEFKVASLGGPLKIKLPQSLDNSHNSDAIVMGHSGIYKYGVPVKADNKDAAFYKIPIEFSLKTELLVDKKCADKLMVDFIDKDMTKVDFSSIKWKYTDINGNVKEIDDKTKVSDFAVEEKK